MKEKRKKVLVKMIEEIALENDVGGYISAIYHKDKKVYPINQGVKK